MRIFPMLLIVLASTGCAAVDQPPTDTMESVMEDYGDVEIEYDCDEAAVGAYGKQISDAECVITANDPNMFLKVNDYWIPTMTWEKIIEVNASGVRLITPRARDTDICSGVPRRKSVDGKQIDQLPMDDQIAAVLNGSIYARENYKPWPRCYVYDQSTRLTGIQEAYRQMMLEWRNMRGG